MSWTTVFPVLTQDHIDDYKLESTPEEKQELNEWFGILRRLNVQPWKKHVVSFSLFWKNAKASSPELPPPSRESMIQAHHLGLVERYHPWEHYVKPLLQSLPELVVNHPDVSFRIYLARDLEFLADDFTNLGCEVFLMRHSSIRYCPGGLWRFLAYGEKGKLVTIADTDRIVDVGSDIERTKALEVSNLGAWRVPLASDFGIEGTIQYCPFLGGQSGIMGGMPISTLIKAFVWHSRRGSFQDMCDVPGCGPKKVRGTNWPDYWFDQWFLTAAVYPRIAARGIMTFVPTSARSFLLPLDIEYTMWANPRSEIIYFQSRMCCGGASPKSDKPISIKAIPSSETESESTPPEPKLGLMFLTNGDVNHPRIWREYLEGFNGRALVHSHPKEIAALKNGFLEGTSVSDPIPTAWGEISLVRATLLMLEKAMSDRDTTHFALLSENCIPAKPAVYLLNALMMDPRPRMNVEGLAQMTARMPDKAGRIHSARSIPKDHWQFHDQWMILDRKAASAILANDLSTNFASMFAADESYFGTVLSMAGWQFTRDIVPKCPTWTKWHFDRPGPQSFTKVSGTIAAEIAESGCFFARKFPAGSDVGRWNFHMTPQAYVSTQTAHAS